MKILVSNLSFILFFVLGFNSCAQGYSLDFFEKFNDPYLISYIKEALSNNHSLKELDHNIEQYRQEINKEFAKELPSLSLSSNYLGVHVPNGDYNIFLGRNSYILPFRVSYEPDILLKTKDKINLAKHTYSSKRQKRDSSYISLLSDVASSYINILLYDYNIKKQKEILDNRRNTLSLDKSRFNSGVIDLVNLNNSYDDLGTNEILYSVFEKNLNTTLYNFCILIGRSPDLTPDIKRGKLEEFEYKDKIPASISSDKIYSRPDIKEIEEELRAAKIDITIAKKDFFPTFNITGFLAFDTAGGGNFFSWGSSFAYILAGLSQDIFSGGRKFANFKLKKARYLELFEKYKQKDLTAIKEVNNALNIINQDTNSENISKQKQKLKESDFLISKKKYKLGTISLLDLIKQKNSLNIQEQITASSKAQRLVDYITLYKALGGEL